jgi:hypothetical protein
MNPLTYRNAGFVGIRSYLRYRLDRWESVRAHRRRWPQPRK